MEYFRLLNSTKIFADASEFECQAMMFCFKTRFKTFDKNQKIISQDEPMEDAVLILKGAANVENIDGLGNISILMRVRAGDCYGLEQAFNRDKVYKDSLVATEKTFVMFMNAHRLITPCDNRCKRHDFVLKNLMKIVSENNMRLLDKLNHMSKKTTREKLLSYFNAMQEKSDNTYFEIPFNKTELASFLSVDRSAMSFELSKMKKEGLIDFEKKQYHLVTSKTKKHV